MPELPHSDTERPEDLVTSRVSLPQFQKPKVSLDNGNPLLMDKGHLSVSQEALD